MKARYCRHCGALLPAGTPQFCIECGKSLHSRAQTAPPASVPQSSAGQATVRLANANVEQTVIGGTMRLPTSGAVPPGLWLLESPPGPEDVVAVYAPLRAVVGGWSGLEGKGWQKLGSGVDPHNHSWKQFRFVAKREWFPAPGHGQGLRLKVRIEAESQAELGRERRGFRYREHYDPPMRISEAHWLNDTAPDRPLPQIQIMAPPRVPRISDLDEQVQLMARIAAEEWDRRSELRDDFLLLNPNQQHTPAGRGLVLARLPRWLGLPRLDTVGAARYRVLIRRPFRCRWRDWSRERRRINDEARELGLDLGTHLAVEWWLDRQGYDSVLLDEARTRYEYDQVVIVFRRQQIVQIGS